MSFYKRSLIMRFVPIFMIGIAFFAVQVSDASGQGLVNEILSRMDAHNKALTALQADVTRVDFNSQLGVSDTREGTVYYRPDPKDKKNPAVRIDWKSPSETLAIAKGQYVLYRPALKQAYIGSTASRQKDSRAGGALSFLTMSRAELKANYKLEYLGEETIKSGVKTWHLRLTPNTITSYKVADLWVNGNGMVLQSKITEKNDDSMTILLRNENTSVTIPGSKFKVDYPKASTKEIKG